VGIPVHDNTHMQWEDRAQYFEQIRAKIAELPEVEGAGISTNATPPSNGMNTLFEIFGLSSLQEQQARVNFVSPEYFTVLHIPLAAGRMWTHAETMRGARLALVNQTLARQYWPKGNAIGQQIRVPQLKAQPPYSLGVPDSDGWLQIVGVVADARDDGLRKPIQPGIYVPYTLTMRMFTQILVRARGEPLALLTSVRRQVLSIDADQQTMGNVRDLEQWISGQPEWAGERLVMILLSGFSILALALAVFGLYSVVSHMVVRRTNEFGLRMALGAQRGDVLRLVFSSTAWSVGGVRRARREPRSGFCGATSGAATATTMRPAMNAAANRTPHGMRGRRRGRAPSAVCRPAPPQAGPPRPATAGSPPDGTADTAAVGLTRAPRGRAGRARRTGCRARS